MENKFIYKQILFILNFVVLRRMLAGRDLWESKDNRKWGHDMFEELTTPERHYEEVDIFLMPLLNLSAHFLFHSDLYILISLVEGIKGKFSRSW